MDYDAWLLDDPTERIPCPVCRGRGCPSCKYFGSIDRADEGDENPDDLADSEFA